MPRPNITKKNTEIFATRQISSIQIGEIFCWATSEILMMKIDEHWMIDLESGQQHPIKDQRDNIYLAKAKINWELLTEDEDPLA